MIVIQNVQDLCSNNPSSEKWVQNLLPFCLHMYQRSRVVNHIFDPNHSRRIFSAKCQSRNGEILSPKICIIFTFAFFSKTDLPAVVQNTLVSNEEKKTFFCPDCIGLKVLGHSHHISSCCTYTVFVTVIYLLWYKWMNQIGRIFSYVLAMDYFEQFF
jgi:hypothetical protein